MQRKAANERRERAWVRSRQTGSADQGISWRLWQLVWASCFLLFSAVVRTKMGLVCVVWRGSEVLTMVNAVDVNNVTPPNIKPAISPSVHLSLTIVYTSLYGFLFLTVYVQLWMILYYKHRRFSYQSVFLFLCLIWAGLRTTLFTFYFRNCLLANTLSFLPYWLLYCFPVCLQFSTLCLLVLFFAQVRMG